MQRLKWFVLVGVLALVLGVVEAAPAAAAKGGNNDAAKVCQRGGWQALIARSGEAFKNQGDCVNDGAQANPPFGTQGKAACDAIPGGLFSQDNPKVWQCNYSEGDPPNYTYRNSLDAACELDTNGLGFLVLSGGGENAQALCEL
jgi:hypothetical protein